MYFLRKVALVSVFTNIDALLGFWHSILKAVFWVEVQFMAIYGVCITPRSRLQPSRPCMQMYFLIKVQITIETPLGLGCGI